MEVKNLLSILVISLAVFSVSAFALPDCREHSDIKVTNTYAHYIFNKEGTQVVGEEVRRGPLVLHWSNLSDKLFDVFYEYTDKSYEADRVQVSYDYKSAKAHSFKLQKVENNLYKIKDFSFAKYVVPASLRPASQRYIFMRGDKKICSIKMQHFLALEDDQ